MPEAIHTTRLVIRPLTSADGDAVVSTLNNLDVSRWLVPIRYPFTPTDLCIVNQDGSSRWPDLAAITCDGQLIGGIGMGAKLGYYLSPQVWSKGFGKEAARAAVDFSFAHLKVEKTEAGYFVGNTASARILAALGFAEAERTNTHCAALKRPAFNLRQRGSQMSRECAAWQGICDSSLRPGALNAARPSVSVRLERNLWQARAA